MATGEVQHYEASEGTAATDSSPGRWRRAWPAWLLLALICAVALSNLFALGRRALQGNAANDDALAPFFAPTVQEWGDALFAWSREYELPVNLLATVMQLESCGRVDAISPAGALGLFQVMPFHFAAEEEPLAPPTNAFRGAAFLRECQGYAEGDITLTLACYNGGPGVTQRPYASWPRETQAYARWGAAIYQDAARGRARSNALDDWWDAGGRSLCAQAAAVSG